jgi:hypothetical protein
VDAIPNRHHVSPRAAGNQPANAIVPSLSTFRDAAVVGGIYAFFAGWAYLTYYLRFFGIPPTAVDSSLYTTTTMAVNLAAPSQAIAAKVLTISIVGVGLVAAGRLPAHRRAITWGLALGLFPLLQLVAHDAAVGIASTRLRTGNFDRVAFVFRPESQMDGTLSKETELCLIHQSAERYYVASCPADPTQARRVLEIRASDVRMATISAFQSNRSR